MNQTTVQVIGLWLLAVIMLYGCGGVVVGPNYPRVITWTPDPGCPELTDRQWRSMDVATELWAAWHVDLVPEANPDAAHVLVCFHPAEPRKGFTGYATKLGPGRYRIDIDGREMAEHDRDSVTPHEFGHVVLPGSGKEDHLPDHPDIRGIMSHTVGRMPNPPQWTEADYEHLIAQGLVPVE